MAVSNRTKRILHGIGVIIQIFLNVLFYVVVVMGTVGLCRTVYEYSYQIFGDVSMEEPPGHELTVEIGESEGTMQLAVRLENKGLVTNRYTFYIHAKLTTGSKRPILPGVYQLNTSMNYSDILTVITREAGDDEGA